MTTRPEDKKREDDRRRPVAGGKIHAWGEAIHCHIYYNSTSLDCSRKFRNFWGSSFALRRLSDRLCLENGLSIVENPKPRSKSKYKHYGEWQKERKRPLSKRPSP